MTQYGSETIITPTKDGQDEETNYFRDYESLKKLKRVTRQKKVKNKQEETTQYLLFTDKIEELRSHGELAYKDQDPASRPSFTLLFPKTDIDGSYFVVTTYTTVMV